jgi:hypothetical protein
VILGGAGLAAVVLVAAAGAAVVFRDPEPEPGPAPTPVTTASPGPTPRPAGPAGGSTAALPPCPAAPTGDLGGRALAKGQAPRDLVVTPQPDGRSAEVRWNDPNGGASAYVVFIRCTGPDNRAVGAVRTVPPGRPPAVTVDGLRIDLNYCFSVGVVEPTGGSTLFTDPTDRTQFRCLDGTRL